MDSWVQVVNDEVTRAALEPFQGSVSFFELATDRVMGRGAQRTRPPGC